MREQSYAPPPGEGWDWHRFATNRERRSVRTLRQPMGFVVADLKGGGEQSERRCRPGWIVVRVSTCTQHHV
uniref:Uncharacterized protein n=1 Tax=Sphaerodactylus townsendi TaxID=933632 RepID=A0ACB8EXR9_9SAUR